MADGYHIDWKTYDKFLKRYYTDQRIKDMEARMLPWQKDIYSGRKAKENPPAPAWNEWGEVAP